MNDVPMLVVAGSAQGSAHKQSNLPNQDTFSYLINEQENIFVAIVSDGAGSAKNAKLGSSFCCHILTEALMNIAIIGIKDKAPHEWYTEQIAQKVREYLDFLGGLGEDIKSFHHTMSAVIISPIGSKAIQIGDSPIIIITNDGTATVDNNPDLTQSLVIDEQKTGEYVNYTNFLTSSNWEKYLKILELPNNILAAFLMSDGAGSVFTSRKKLHAPAMLELIRRFRDYQKPIDVVLDDFLNMKELNSKTSDDKTLVVYIPKKWVSNSDFSELYQTHNISEDIRIENITIKNPINTLEQHPNIELPKKINNDIAYSN